MYSNKGSKMVQNGDSILISHHSHVLEKLLCNAVDQGKIFTLYFLGTNSPAFQEMALRLQKVGIKIIYAHLSNIPFYIKDVDKIFITSICVYSNGSVLTEVGAASVAVFAHIYKKPVYLFTRTYKFSSKTQIDPLSVNMCTISKSKELGVNVHSLSYDLVPCKYFTVFVTEIGIISPWSVPMLVKKFSVQFEKSLMQEGEWN